MAQCLQICLNAGEGSICLKPVPRKLTFAYVMTFHFTSEKESSPHVLTHGMVYCLSCSAFFFNDIPLEILNCDRFHKWFIKGNRRPEPADLPYSLHSVIKLKNSMDMVLWEWPYV